MDTKAGSSEHGHHPQPDHSHTTHGMRHDHDPANATTVKDPVCGMDVTLGAGKPSFQHDSKTWHFCSQKYRDKFAADPAHCLTGEHKKCRSCHRSRTSRYAIHLPDVSRDHPRRAGRLPEMRHGSRVHECYERRRRPQSRVG